MPSTLNEFLDKALKDVKLNINEEKDQTRIAIAFAYDALQSILNIENAAKIGAQSGALKGLDWKKPFDKVRKAIKEIQKVKKPS